MNHKTIKLFGGSHDGEIIEVPHSQKEWITKDVMDPSVDPIQFIYRETLHRAANGEVIFSCYDYMLELR